jgi:hypothetical protein
MMAAISAIRAKCRTNRQPLPAARRSADRAAAARPRDSHPRPIATSAAKSAGRRCGRAQLTDRLSLSNALADANIDRKAAERIATEIFDAIHDNVATKADLQLLKSELETRIAQLEHRLITLGIRAPIVAIGIVLAAIRYLRHS